MLVAGATTAVVSAQQGKVVSRYGPTNQGVTLDYYEVFNGILNPKQLEGLRLLVTQFPQQQFNASEDRRTDRPSLGVTCFDCHADGHTNGANHLVGDIRLQEFRLRDGRCFTLEDTVEYFNLVQQLQLTAPEKQDLAAFLVGDGSGSAS